MPIAFTKKGLTLKRKNRLRRPHKYVPNDYVLVHKSRFPHRHFKKIETPWLGPFRILETTSSKLKVAASPSLGGEILVSVEQCKSWKDFVDESSDEDETTCTPETNPDSQVVSPLQENSSSSSQLSSQ